MTDPTRSTGPTGPTGPTNAVSDRPAVADSLEGRVLTVGRDLRSGLSALLDAVPGGPSRPQDLVTTLSIDKVLSSRFLKAVRQRNPMAVVHLAPGPEPMRRVVRAARRRGTPADVADAAMQVIDAFEQLIRREAGDRGALNTMISSWLPEARIEFEMRRKQAAFRAMSELRGCRTDVNISTVILHPSDDGEHIDIVWIFGFLGLQRLRPDARVKFAIRRIADLGEDAAPRTPRALGGEPVAGMNAVRLDQFCDAPPAMLQTHTAGDATHYELAGNDIGPRSGVDLVCVEVNAGEMPRFVPAGSGRKGFVFAEVSIPSAVLHFDVLVHQDVYPGQSPELLLYDTVLEGVADVNDRSRDADRLDMQESAVSLGTGTGAWRTTDSPNQVELIGHVLDRMGWDAGAYRGYRTRIECPIYGSQVAMAFAAPERAE
ncbi:MAG: hypothetical protein AB8G96_10490 [Phycisphaerales bacterium]